MNIIRRTCYNAHRWYLPGILLVVLLACTSCAISLAKGATSTGTTTTAKQGTTPTSNFSMFVGTWENHSSTLIFTPNGQASYRERTYRWCGPNVPSPCDSIQNNVIQPGIIETLAFTQVQGNTAYGTIIASTVNNVGQSVSLTVQDNDTVTLDDGAPLCGPNAPVGWCGA
jgi:hypothetical protein